MKNISYRLIIAIILAATFFKLNGQSDLELKKLSPKEIFEANGFEYNDIKHEFEFRLSEALSQSEAKYQLLKYFARINYKFGELGSISGIYQQLDSIEQTLPKLELDPSFEFEKIYFHTGYNHNVEKAFYLLDKIKGRIETTLDTSLLITWNTSMARTHLKADNRAEGLQFLFTAAKLNEVYKDSKSTAFITMTRAGFDWADDKFKSSIEKYIEAEKMYKQLGITSNLFLIYRNIINAAKDTKNESLAINYTKKLNALRKETGSTKGYYVEQVNAIFELIEKGEFKQAKDLAQKTIVYAEDNNQSAAHPTYLMGVAYRGLMQYSKASSLIQRAYDLAKEQENIGACSFYAHALYQTHYWQEKFAPALQWFSTHVEHKDSLYNESKAKQIAVLELKLNELEQNKKLGELKSKLEIERQKKYILWLIIVFGGILALALVSHIKQKAKNKSIQQNALLKQSILEKELLENELEFKRKEVVSHVLHMTQKNKVLQEIKLKLREAIPDNAQQAINKLVRLIDLNTNSQKEWDAFLLSFKSIHSSFLDKLNSLSNSLSANDVKIASLMKMNISSKDIAQMLNITDDGIKKARYRLRKKIDLASEVNIQEYLLKL